MTRRPSVHVATACVLVAIAVGVGIFTFTSRSTHAPAPATPDSPSPTCNVPRGTLHSVPRDPAASRRISHRDKLHDLPVRAMQKPRVRTTGLQCRRATVALFFKQ